ncbi:MULTISPECIES: uracil-xanthine permease family protein [Carnobacterium]|uniref:Uracil-xanthine permease family protein n=1 Tax=Carnobacterium antarcticum TaxID=2126436 RepID=A0ABW4NNT6_9LACT|nr:MULTISPECIES: solute carrier family 23 protein [unclassified Carnobacterium]ALV22527.1 Xanthine permease [Carnobacterium sp. CP1]QQP70449.1 purine/pyrimidine permease [Carnobacterium sp. CS13]
METTQTILTVGTEEPISWKQSFLLGLQHLLAMDVYVVPFIVALTVGFSASQSAILIQSTFIAAGIATIIQSGLLMKMPVAQGASFIPIGAIAGITLANGGGMEGWGAAMGASFLGAIVVTILGFTGLFHKFIDSFVPSAVGGTIIFCVGLSLMPAAVNDNIYNSAVGSIGQNIFLALITGAIMIGCSILGNHSSKSGRIFRIASVITALFAGSILAGFMGMLDLTSVAEAKWFSMPQFIFKDFTFSFDFSAIVTMLIIYIVLIAETTGTWLAVSNVTNTPLNKDSINRGVIGEGLGCMTAALFGTTPVTGYSSNAGIISITGIASRRVFLAAGGLFIVFGLSGKLSALISSVPSAVIGGVFALVCGVIAMSGFQVLKQEQIGQKETYVVSIPILLVVALTFLPTDYLDTLPTMIQYLFGSPIAIAALTAIILNKVLPQN